MMGRCMYRYVVIDVIEVMGAEGRRRDEEGEGKRGRGVER
jgi:hypothetical protein